MFEQIKQKFAKTLTEEITQVAVKKTKGFRRFLPKLFGCLAVVGMLLSGIKSVPAQAPSQTVNNYYIYNGPVYSHE